jgi:hypothetical protein
MSYQLETNTDSSKIIHLNTNDADTYLQSGITTYCSFVLDTPIIVDKEHACLISLNSAIIPYSMYNIRSGVNNSIPFRYSSDNRLGFVIIPEGNYTITTLANKISELLNAVDDLSGNYTISFDRVSMKYTYFSSVSEIFFDFSTRTDISNIEMGFGEKQSTGVISSLGIISENVPDVNGSIHSLFIRTNLTSKSSIDSQTKSFSTILGKIPIDTNFGGVLFFNPRDNTQKILIDTHIINILTIRITDEKNRNLNLNGLNCNLSIMIDIVNKTDFIKKDNRRTQEIYLENKNKERINEIEKNKKRVGRPRNVGRPKKK